LVNFIIQPWCHVGGLRRGRGSEQRTENQGSIWMSSVDGLVGCTTFIAKSLAKVWV
jgi:hypothetical protein